MEETQYLSYLLRLWTVNTASGTTWRASLESPLTGDRLGFQDLEALITYLEWIIQDPSSAPSFPSSDHESKEN